MASSDIKVVSYLLSVGTLLWFVLWSFMFQLKFEAQTYEYVVPRGLPIIALLTLVLGWRKTTSWMVPALSNHVAQSDTALAISLMGNFAAVGACYFAFNGNPEGVYSDELSEAFWIVLSSAVCLVFQALAVKLFLNMKGR